MLTSKAENIDGAVKELTKIAGYAPFRFGGNWFVCRANDEFAAYRTKKAAISNSIDGIVWRLKI